MDVLETYPRDELFQTPIDELVPIAEAVLHTRERRQLRLFVRRDTYGRYLSCLVYLPRDRYNTAVRERIADDPQAAAARRVHRVHRPGQRVAARPAALRGPPAQGRRADRATSTPPTSSGGSPRRPGPGATTSSPRCTRSTARRRAPGWPAATPTRSPRPTRRTTPPRTGAVDLGRLEAIDRATSGLDLSLYQPIDAGPRRGAAEGLPDRRRRCRCPRCCRCCRRWASRSSTSGPTGSRGCERRVAHLRLRAALRPARCPSGSRELFQDAVAAVWEGDNEVDGFNALVLAAGLDLAAGHRAARLREVHAPGRHPVRAGLHRGRAGAATSTSPALLVALFEARFDPGRNGDIAADGEARRREDGRDRGADQPRPRRRRQPRPRPDPALVPDRHQGDPAHQLLPARRPSGAAQVLHLAQARARRDPGPARAAAAVRDLRLLAAGRGRAPALRRRSPAAACAGRTGATTSAPRCSAWSRRRWSRTP